MAIAERMLRIRSLLEDASRAVLEQQVQRAQETEKALGRVAASARQARADGLAPLFAALPATQSSYGRIHKPGIGEETADQSRERYLAESESEAGRAAQEALRARAEEQARNVLACRAEFLLKRTEREQVEILVEEAARRRAAGAARREQRALDDWFASSRTARARREKATPSGSRRGAGSANFEGSGRTGNF